MGIDRRFLEISLAVQGIVDEPPASPAPVNGTQYIVGTNGTGVFADADPNMLARYNGVTETWKFTAPATGRLEVLNLATSEILAWDGSAWSVIVQLGGGSDGSGVTVVDGVVYTGTNLPDVQWHEPYDCFINTSTGKYYRLNDTTGDGDLSWQEISDFYGEKRYASIDNGKIYARNGGSTFEATGELKNGELVFISSWAGPRKLCIYEASSRSLLSVATAKDFGEVTDDEGTLYIGSHTLTADDISRKGFILPTAIMRDSNDKRHMLVSVEGVQMVQGVDFGIGGDIAEDTWLNWNNKGMAQIGLVPGDVVCFAYAYASK